SRRRRCKETRQADTHATILRQATECEGGGRRPGRRRPLTRGGFAVLGLAASPAAPRDQGRSARDKGESQARQSRGSGARRRGADAGHATVGSGFRRRHTGRAATQPARGGGRSGRRGRALSGARRAGTTPAAVFGALAAHTADATGARLRAIRGSGLARLPEGLVLLGILDELQLEMQALLVDGTVTVGGCSRGQKADVVRGNHLRATGRRVVAPGRGVVLLRAARGTPSADGVRAAAVGQA